MKIKSFILLFLVLAQSAAQPIFAGDGRGAGNGDGKGKQNNKNETAMKSEPGCEGSMAVRIFKNGKQSAYVPFHKFMYFGIEVSDDSGPTPDDEEDQDGKTQGKSGAAIGGKDLSELVADAQVVKLVSCTGNKVTVKREQWQKTPNCYVMGLNRKGSLKMTQCKKGNIKEFVTGIRGITEIHYSTEK